MLKPDIIQTLSREGIHVKQNKAHCPFHEDDTPSLMVYPSNNSWYCFGCNIGGDAIEFIRRHRGLSYKQAISHLGVKDRQPCKRDILRLDKIREFKEWERRYHAELCQQYRTIQNHKSLVWDMDDIHAEAYHAEAYIIHQIDILDGGDMGVTMGLYSKERLAPARCTARELKLKKLLKLNGVGGSDAAITMDDLLAMIVELNMKAGDGCVNPTTS